MKKNAQRRTSNTQRRMQSSALKFECSAFGVRRSMFSDSPAAADYEHEDEHKQSMKVDR